jgi:DNA-binding IclR family transcriptional regulator
MPGDDAGTLQTTTTSLAIIDAINEANGARMSDLAEHLDLATSTVHTHLRTLLEEEYLIKEGEIYRLGLKLFHLGEGARTRHEWYEAARRTVHEVANRSGEEVSFAVEEHGRAIMLFNRIANPSVKGFQVGRYFYMHGSATGKAILSELPSVHVERILDRWGLPAVTDATITDREELARELERTRERGYAVNDQESVEGLRAVGVPVRDPSGRVFGALDVSGPPYRLPPNEELAGLLTTAAEELAADLRARGHG